MHSFRNDTISLLLITLFLDFWISFSKKSSSSIPCLPILPSMVQSALVAGVENGTFGEWICLSIFFMYLSKVFCSIFYSTSFHLDDISFFFFLHYSTFQAILDVLASSLIGIVFAFFQPVTSKLFDTLTQFICLLYSSRLKSAL